MFKKKSSEPPAPTVVVVREHEREVKETPKPKLTHSLREFVRSRRYKTAELQEAEDMSDLFEARKEIQDATLAGQRGD